MEDRKCKSIDKIKSEIINESVFRYNDILTDYRQQEHRASNTRTDPCFGFDCFAFLDTIVPIWDPTLGF